MANPPHKTNQPKAQRPTVKSAKAPESAVLKPVPKNENIFIYTVLAAYFVIGLVGVFHHEMWRDELQIWLIGAANNGFSQFMHNLNGEPTPFLWVFLNFVVSRFSDSPFTIQIFHLLISVGSVCLILKYSPFSRLQKVFLCFSYYILFEYTLLARGYGLTILFLFLFCAFYQIKSKNRYLILSLFLVGLSNATGGEGIILTLSLLLMMMIDYFFSEDYTIRKKYSPKQLFISAFIALFGIYTTMKTLAPTADNHYGNNWFTAIDLQRIAITLRTFWMSLLPIPQYSIVNFWNTNVFFTHTTGDSTFTLLFVFSLFIFLSCILLYSKKLSILLFYLAATFGILLFCYTNGVIYSLLAVRHYGFIFVTFVAAAWLAPEIKKSKFNIPGLVSLGNKLNIEKNFTYIVTGLFAINMIGGIIAYSKDYSLPFSNIKMTGDYITSHHLDKLPEAGFIDYAISPISAYTKHAVYCPDRDTVTTYTTWGEAKFSFDPNVLISRLINFISHQKDSVLFISTGDYFGIGEGRVISNIQFTRIAAFSGAIVADESYILYIARRFDLNKVMQDQNSYSNPTTVSAILSAGYDLMQKGQLDNAGKIFTTVEDKSKGMAVPHLHNYLGMLYTKKNMPSDAEKEFNTEITLNLQKEEAFFNLGMLYFQSKNYPSAIKSWDSTLSIDPKNADALNNLGAAYLNYKGDNATAKSYFEKALELNPNYIQGYYNLLSCAQNTNDEESLIKYIRILLDKKISIDDIKARGIRVSDELLQKINSR